MAGNSKIAISWSNLPNDLLEKISKCLHTETDVRRFRAVCNSWRSSTTSLKKFPNSPLNLPFPFAAGEPPHLKHDGAYLSLTERIVYRLQPPNCSDLNFWLVKIEISRDGKSRILNPVSEHEIKLLPETKIPKVLNTLDFRLYEVCKGYTLDYVNPAKPNKKYGYKFAKKVAVSLNANNDEYVVTVIDYCEELWYIKSGHQKWTKVVNDRFGCWLDILNYKGRFYGIETGGDVWLFDSLFEGQIVAYSEDHGPSNRHLVELFDGELVLVDEVTYKFEGECTCQDFFDEDVEVEYECHCNISKAPVTSTAEKIIISRMDESRGEWFKAEFEVDGIIFLGDDCSFSFSAEELKNGCKGTRVFYSDPYICFRTKGEMKPHFHDDCDYCYEDFECYCCRPPVDIARVDNFIANDDVKLKFRGLNGHNTGVCDFETGKLGSLLKFPEYAEIFWPPPSWLNRC